MNTVKYQIPAISCMHCAHTIKSELMELPGISTVDVDMTVKEVRIEYSDPVTPAAIEKALIEINYPPKK